MKPGLKALSLGMFILVCALALGSLSACKHSPESGSSSGGGTTTSTAAHNG